MAQNNPNPPESQIKLKVQSGIEERAARFQKMRRNQKTRWGRRKIKLQIAPERGKEKKELKMGETREYSSDIFRSEENLGIVLILGFTLSLINDFSDLVTWRSAPLVAETLDITTLILLLFVLVFVSRAYFLSVAVVMVAFLSEALPVSGVLPWWTVGMAVWYWLNRRGE